MLRIAKLITVAAVLTAALAAPGRAQMSGRDARFVEGLQQRGLLTLLERYLEILEAEGADREAILRQQAALYEMQGTRAAAEDDRDEMFGRAKEKYRELVDLMNQRIEQTSEPRQQDQLRLEVYKLKIHVAEMIWQRQAHNQITNLELTDRERGDRKKVESLMREAGRMYREVNQSVSEWMDEMEASSEFQSRYMNLYDEALQIRDYALYQTGWTSYYQAFATPEDDKEAREELLKNAISKFETFTLSEDDFQAKWEAMEGIGLCYREQGRFDEAVATLRKALQSKQETFKIHVYYELAQTYARAGEYEQARQAVQELRGQNYAKLQETFIGQHLLPFLEAKILLAEGAGQNDPAKKDRGLKMMRELWNRGQFWHMLVSAEVGKYVSGDEDIESMRPFELWIVASETYQAGDIEQAKRYFEQYIKITQASDPTHPEAMNNLAACYYRLAEDANGEQRLSLLRSAGNLFHQIASQYPDFHAADQAANSYVYIAHELVDNVQSEENIDYLADALKWSIENRPQAAEAGNMYWQYGNVLEHRGDYLAAADVYAKVSRNSPNYYEAMYRSPNARYLDLRENKWMNLSADELRRQTEQVVARMADYAAEIEQASLEGELRDKLRRQAAEMLIKAAEVLATDKIEAYERGLELVERAEQSFADQEELTGKMLKVKIDCLRGQGRLDQARAELDRLMQSGEDPGPILESLFAAITDEVDRLVRQNRPEEAAEKVALAAEIGSQFIDYLSSRGDTRRVIMVEYQLAELHRSAELLEGKTGAIARYIALIKFDPYEKQDYQTINLDYLEGLAKSMTRLAEKKSGRDAYDHYQKAAYYWGELANGYQALDPADDEEREKLNRSYWEATLEQMRAYVALHPLEQQFGDEDKTDYNEMVRTFIASNRALESEFGGQDLKYQFDRLYDRVQ